jgi:hypothetical protein
LVKGFAQNGRSPHLVKLRVSPFYSGSYPYGALGCAVVPSSA